MERRAASGVLNIRWTTRWAIAPAAVLALLVAWADQDLASTSREAAVRLAAQFEHKPRAVWFQGHWGFQYYAQRLGFIPLDYRHPAIKEGDLIVKAEGISNPIALPEGSVELVSDVTLDSFSWLSTMSLPLGAGFYSDFWGPLPYAFGHVPPERYRVYRAVVPLVAPLRPEFIVEE